MKKSKVFYTNARALHYRYEYSLPAKYKALIEASEFAKYIPPQKRVAVKTHFGSQGSFRVVRPNFLRITVDAVKAATGVPFLTDTWSCLLYTSDAADELLCVALGGRRILKTKN